MADLEQTAEELMIHLVDFTSCYNMSRKPGALIKSLPKDKRDILKNLKSSDLQHWIYK